MAPRFTFTYSTARNAFACDQTDCSGVLPTPYDQLGSARSSRSERTTEVPLSSASSVQAMTFSTASSSMASLHMARCSSLSAKR